MKKLTMICMSALLMLAVSCKKDKKDGIENAGSGFRATVESHEGTGKTHLEDLAVKWDSGDAILVKSKTCTTALGFTTQGSGATVNFDANATLPTNFYEPPYTGYYPATAFSGDRLTLPPTQQYDENNTFASGANPMAATSSDNVLPFKNVCGVLKLQLYSATPCRVRSISITSNTGEMLWGTGTVGFDAADDNDNPTLGALTGGGSTLTLNCNGETMSVNSSSPSTYFFVVPVGTLGTSFTVKVTDSNGKVWTKTANAPANSIVRSHITVLPIQAVETKPGIPEGALPGLFTVSDNGTPDDATDDIKVYFSQGNLQYTTTGSHSVAGGGTATGTWRFAEHQFDFVGDLTSGNVYEGGVKCNNENAAQSYDGWIDLFGWGTSGYHQSTDSDNVNYQPWATPTLTSFVGANNFYGYGPSTNVTPEGPSGMTQSQGNISGSYYDWGVNCAISNGGNQAGKWRTLTTNAGGEWVYLLNTRTMKYGKPRYTNKTTGGITIGGTTYYGLFIYPDDYNGTEVGVDATTETWDKINGLGIVFLPAAGYRTGTAVGYAGYYGFYWSSSYSSNKFAYIVSFYGGDIYPDYGNYRCYGMSVRLVSEN